MKRKNVGIIIIMVTISIILVSVTFFYNKSLGHKEEINKLLLARDILKENSKSDNQGYSLISEWSEEKNTISKDFITEVKNDKNSPNEIYDDDKDDNTNPIESNDTMLLAKLINSEAGDEPYDGKIAVANVVLYRTQESKQTISNIIYSPGQFDGVNTKLFLDKPSDESIKAAREALNGKKILNKAYYFANLKLCSPSWATKDKFICRIGDHWFFEE